MTTKPILWIIAGPNGSGKSTLINKLSSLLKMPSFVNPDAIAAALDPINKNDPKVIAKAGRIAIELRTKYIKQNLSFGIETTLTGNSSIKIMQKALTNGYRLNLIFIGLDSVAISLFRVASRVQEGGHNVPTDAILRRYPQSLKNLIKTSSYANKLYVFDNSGIKHNLLLNMEEEKTKYLAKYLPNWSKNLIPKIIEQRKRLLKNVNKENSQVLIGGKVQEEKDDKWSWLTNPQKNNAFEQYRQTLLDNIDRTFSDKQNEVLQVQSAIEPNAPKQETKSQDLANEQQAVQKQEEIQAEQQAANLAKEKIEAQDVPMPKQAKNREEVRRIWLADEAKAGRTPNFAQKQEKSSAVER